MNTKECKNFVIKLRNFVLRVKHVKTESGNDRRRRQGQTGFEGFLWKAEGFEASMRRTAMLINVTSSLKRPKMQKTKILNMKQK